MKTKVAAKPEVQIPEGDGTKHTLIGKHIVFVSILQDSDTRNPCTDMDGVGIIRSLSTRHINRIDVHEARELLRDDPDVIPLSYFEHGRSLWMVQNDPAPAGVEFQWDGVRFAGVWIPDKCVRESYQGQDGLSRREWMHQQAKSACELYTLWCNGECYGYDVAVYKLRRTGGHVYTDKRDYRFDKPVFDDSCFGYYGLDDVTREVREQIDDALAKIPPR